MVKVMAVLRTLFLVGITGYMLWALPLGRMFSTMPDVPTYRPVELDKVVSGAWVAIGWIAMETAFGWGKAWYQDRRRLKELQRAAASAGAAPTPAP